MKETAFINGSGIICAAGENLQNCLQSIYQGKRNIQPATQILTDHTPPLNVFEVPAFKNEDNPAFFRTTQLAIHAVKEAIASANYTPEILQNSRVGVCMGTTVGSMLNNENYYRNFLKGQNKDVKAIDMFLNNNLSEQIAKLFKLSGPTLTVVNACSSATDAIGIAHDWIINDICDIAICGGADELSRVTLNGFSSLLIANASPCKPFDQNRSGLNLGEGAGVIILDKIQKDKTQGKIVHYETCADAFHLTKPDPDGYGLNKAISKTFNCLNINNTDIAYLNAHGTGTKDNDLIEGTIIKNRLSEVPFNSTKGYTGHTLGAAGGIEAVLTMAFLNNNLLPQSIGFNTLDPEIGIKPLLENSSLQTNKKLAISESLAFGGNNSLIVLEKL